MAASRKIFPYGYLSEIKPSKAFVGVLQPMKVYTVDLLLFTNSDVKSELVYKLIEAMTANKTELIAVAPHLRGFSVQRLHKKYDLAYHPGALKYFADHKIPAMALR